MLHFIITYWLETAFGLICALAVAGYRKFGRRIKEQAAIKEGVLSILHDRIFQAASFYISRDYITIEELRNVRYLYESYHNLGGNGTGTELYNRIKNLEIREE